MMKERNNEFPVYMTNLNTWQPGPMYTTNKKERLDLNFAYYLILPFNKKENILVLELVDQIYHMGYNILEYSASEYNFKRAKKLIDLTHASICVKLPGSNNSERVYQELNYCYNKAIAIYSVDIESIQRDYKIFKGET